jgi:transposase
MRKSFDGHCGIIEAHLGETVESGHLFLFFNRRRDRVKILYFTGDGLVIVYRKLEAGTFETPRGWRDEREGRHRQCHAFAGLLISAATSANCFSVAQAQLDQQGV